jgi:hypothetical protein
VDNFVPCGRLFVDKRSPEGRGVEKAVNPPVNKRLSTELSTLLITYSSVVSELLRALRPAMTRVSAAIPTTFPHLWITCERLVVVKWVTLLGRLPGACSNVGEHAQARVDELCPNEPAISTASYTVGKTRLLLSGSPENAPVRGFLRQFRGCPQKLSTAVDKVTHFCGR